MIAVLQRVRSAQVEIEGEIVGKIGGGLLILLGVTVEDTEQECDALADKTALLRIFEDAAGKMNLSLCDVGGQALVVSQFTLAADCSHGRRPSFIAAARPEQAVPLYERFVRRLRENAQIAGVETGRFGADMLVSLQNEGPVTILLDTKDIL